jgi:hypothetical protein
MSRTDFGGVLAGLLPDLANMGALRVSLAKNFWDMQSLYSPKRTNDAILRKVQRQQWIKTETRLTDIAFPRRVVFPGVMVAMSWAAADTISEVN